MTINVGQPPFGASTDVKVDWLIQAVLQIARELQLNTHTTVTDGFSLTDADALVPLRELDETAATTDEVRQFVATLIDDFRRRGSKGV